MNNREDIVEYLNEVKEAAAVKSDAELAGRLGVGKATISAWRQRGNVPFKTQQQIYDQFGISLLASKKYLPAFEGFRPHIAALIFFLVRSRGDSLVIGTALDTSYWWSRRFPYLNRFFEIELIERCRSNYAVSPVRRFFNEVDIPDSELALAARQIANDIERNRLLALSEIEALPYSR